MLDDKNYLRRIGFEGDPKPDFETLSELQYKHFLAVPYENIDILRKIPISLEISDLYEKIVVNKRGGYCFELNTLFNWLLCEIGFKTITYFARFLFGETQIPMRRHRIMRVEIFGEYYVADVGVGSITPERSLKLVENEETEVRGTLYKFEKEPVLGWVLHVFKKGAWQKLFSFTEDEQFEIDFVQPNFYCQYHEDSIFNKNNMAAIRTETGKYSIDGDIFKTSDAKGNIITEKKCEKDEIPAILKKYFGIDLERMRD
jgi:N-hydroxyarylamine O-acetyltransferase